MVTTRLGFSYLEWFIVEDILFFLRNIVEDIQIFREDLFLPIVSRLVLSDICCSPLTLVLRCELYLTLVGDLN